MVHREGSGPRLVYPFMSHHPHDSDARRNARILFAHRRALLDLQRVTLRYQVHNELAELASSRRLLELTLRAMIAVVILTLAACGGAPFTSGSAELPDAVDAGAYDGAAADAPSSSSADVATIDELELELDAGDARTRDAISSVYLDAGDGVDAAADAEPHDAGDAVDARVCVGVATPSCTVAPGYPYPARCDSQPCCCATP